MYNFEKKYSERSIEQNAAMIACEIITDRKSHGWSGAIEKKEAIERILSKMNITYTDDIHGTWELRIQ